MLLFKSKKRQLQECLDRYKSDPHEALAFKIVGLWAKIGNWTEAFKWAKHARSAYPTSRYALKLYQKTKARRTRESLKQARAFATANPTVENLVRLSEMYRIAGKSKQAFTQARKAEELDPRDWRVQLAFGKLWFDTFSATRSEEDGWTAAEHLDASRCSHPKHYPTLLLLTITLARLGAFDEALAIVTEALRLQPNDHRARQLDQQIRRSLQARDPARRLASTRDDGQGSESEDSVLARLLSLSGAVGAFEFDKRGRIVGQKVRDTARLFDFSVPDEVLERMAAACALDTKRIGLGEFRSCSLSGEGWYLEYHSGLERPVLVFFEGEISGERADAQIESVLGMQAAVAQG
ncbi:MAG TPA: hypothetical protein VK116_09490 [Planctomycetota bacterium]|nr:hypothetical protein [Planctomycetota bacterium]